MDLIRKNDNLLNNSEIKDILKSVENKIFSNAYSLSDYNNRNNPNHIIEKSSRKGQVIFLEESDVPHFKKIQKAFESFMQDEIYVDVDYYEIQLAKYEEGDFFKLHTDSLLDYTTAKKGKCRKLSMSVQLSDPNDYDGGELQVYIPNQTKNKSFKVETLSNEQGAGIIFPSFLDHSVSKLKTGTRLVLVVWANGNFWR